MEYTTVREPATARVEIKRSKFIGDIAPAASEEEAQGFLQAIRARYPDASHHVYAWCLRDNHIQRFSDAGEPSGTAGRPVLDVLVGSGLTDAALVVTRYFGGVLLGAGGLTHAYSQTAAAAVAAAARRHLVWCYELTVNCPYPLYPKLAHVLPDFGATVVESDFGEAVALRLLVREENVAALREAVTALSAGTLDLAEAARRFGALP